MKCLFFVFGFLSVYSYFLYPLLLKLLPARRPLQFRQPEADALPQMSLIIAVHNEQKTIAEKLENSLAIDYPSERLEIIVASDFSTDDTHTIVESYAARGVRLVKADQRLGKEYAQLCAMREAGGEIFVFSDVATRIPADALRKLALYFSEPQVGAVSSEDRYLSSDGSVEGEGAYVRYEMWLRRLESERAGLVGLSGSFFAARREVCADWDIYVCSDFSTARNTAKAGLVAITRPDVIGIYKGVDDPAREYARKLRTVIHGLTAVVRHPEVLNPFKMGGFAFQVWSHKIMRWGVPWFLAVFLLLSFLLADEGLFYALILAGQLLFYTLALLGWLWPAARKHTLVKIIFFFVQSNLALAHATLQFLRGKRMLVWTPSSR